MSSSDGAPRALPDRPSSEHLRKQAKRLARRDSIRLTEAQRRLAAQYGFPDWAALMVEVRALSPSRPLPALAEAARNGDLTRVAALIAEGHDVGEDGGDGGALWQACTSDAPPEVRLAIARALLSAGAGARNGIPGRRPLHAVAGRGPVELAEFLIRHGAIEWEPDIKGRSALDIARRSRAADRAALVELMDRPVVRDEAFRAAIRTIHAGDAAGLARLLDAEPRLLSDRISEPDCYRDSGREQYFLDPKLFWFVADNPTLTTAMPAAMPEVARVMIARGVPKEDLDRTLGLVMTSSSAREADLQVVLARLLIDAGATVDPHDLGGVLGHGETEVVAHLIDRGLTLTAPVAAALGRLDVLPGLLARATRDEVEEALDLAVINNRTDAARLALEAGADPDRFSSQHRHSQPLHQAALHDNVELVELLLAYGARPDAVDNLWGGTPAGWAWYARNPKVAALLEDRAGS